MRTGVISGRHRCLARVSIFLITAALFWVLMGCFQDPIDEYTLTISSTDGGSVTTPGEGAFNYTERSDAFIFAAAETGYRFVNWTGDVDTIRDVNNASTSISMHGDYSITANFEEIPMYTLSISSTVGGRVTSPGEGLFDYREGQEDILVAEAETGYRFVSWTGDVDTIVNPERATTSIRMYGNYSITADFVEIEQYTLTISSTAGGSVTKPGEGTFTYPHGRRVDLTAQAEVGYRFVSWTGDVGTIGNKNSANTNIRMNGNYSITADFEKQEAVEFPDPGLEAATRLAINIPERPIYPSDMERLASLRAEQMDISDLTGLEYATGLTQLYLWGNQISDLSPLAGLVNLTTLLLSSNQISDISALAGLTALAQLSLAFNQISDIKPLVDNPGLSQGDTVYLWGNPLSSESINTYIKQLRERGVSVEYEH